MKLFRRLASYLLNHIKIPALRRMVERRLRKKEVLGRGRLMEETDKFLAEVLAYALMIFTGLLILSVIVLIKGKKEDSRALKRPEVGDNDRVYVIELLKENEVWSEDFKLSARSYTEDEFFDMASAAEDFIRSVYLMDNQDEDHIRTDLYLPESDETGTLSIEWKSEDPLVLNRYGAVDSKELKEAEKVHLEGRISYEEYEKTIELDVKILPYDDEMDELSIAVKELEDMQEESRENEDFQLPESIQGFNVRRKGDEGGTALQLIAMAFIITAVFIYYRIYLLGEAGKKRDRILMDRYYSFINKLILGLSSGMNLRGAFARMVEDEKREKVRDCDVLYREIQVALNEINSGIPEEEAYTGLGKRIGIPEYIRAMSLIEQNLCHGNKDLIKLLEEEERKARFQNRERAKKRGEEASEKLLFPMLILLLVVIGIVIYPAFINI